MSDDMTQVPAQVPPDQIERAWRAWSEAALHPQAPLAQRTALKTAFMAGAATMLGTVIRGQNQQEIVQSAVDEMTTYGQMLGVSQMPELPAGRVVRLSTKSRPRPREM